MDAPHRGMAPPLVVTTWAFLESVIHLLGLPSTPAARGQDVGATIDDAALFEARSRGRGGARDVTDGGR
jgi:hypothetical protein